MCCEHKGDARRRNAVNERGGCLVESLDVVDEHGHPIVASSSSQRGKYQARKIALLFEVHQTEKGSQRNVGGGLGTDDLDDIESMVLQDEFGLVEKARLANACRSGEEQPTVLSDGAVDVLQLVATPDQARCPYRYQSPTLSVAPSMTSTESRAKFLLSANRTMSPLHTITKVLTKGWLSATLQYRGRSTIAAGDVCGDGPCG